MQVSLWNEKGFCKLVDFGLLMKTSLFPNDTCIRKIKSKKSLALGYPYCNNLGKTFFAENVSLDNKCLDYGICSQPFYQFIKK